MAKQSLAVKYRPQTWDDVTEQNSIKTILKNQLSDSSVKHAYLFCGGAGTGKTTCARIFAREINAGHGSPIEMDSASHNSVDDIRNIAEQAKLKSLDSEYRVYIMDEVHALSNSAWQAMLKLIEEPPAKTIFIFCTTDPQKIPKTILSRVQRYDFQKISLAGIVARLEAILATEGNEEALEWDTDAIEYIAKLAEGGMRDAITLLDKCISYSRDITVSNVVKALGVADYSVLRELADNLVNGDCAGVVEIVESIHSSGADMKAFIKRFLTFSVDVNTYIVTRNIHFCGIPATDENIKWLDSIPDNSIGIYNDMMRTTLKLNAELAWETSPKTLIVARFLLFAMNEEGT